MKHVLILVFLINSSICAFSQNKAVFRLSTGAGLQYSIQNYTTGFTGKIALDFFETVRIAPSYTKYLRSFETSGSGNLDVESWESDALLQWLLETSDYSVVYLSGGFNHHEKTTTSQSGITKEYAQNRLKIGLGIQVNLGNWKVLGDYHYSVGNVKDHILSLGFLYTFYNSKK